MQAQPQALQFTSISTHGYRFSTAEAEAENLEILFSADS